MARRIKKINYREKYPEVSDEIIEVLEKSDRKMEYQQYDLKVERYQVDYNHLTINRIPSREDSYERLLEENRQFTSEESVEDEVVKAILIEKMLYYLNQLTLEEQELITELFYNQKSEETYAKQIGLSQRGINKRKHKILSKLKKMMQI